MKAIELTMIHYFYRHIGLGRSITDEGKLILTLFMKKISNETNLIPKGFLQDQEEKLTNIYGSDIWELSQTGLLTMILAFLFKIILTLCTHNTQINEFIKKSRSDKRSGNYIQEVGRIEED